MRSVSWRRVRLLLAGIAGLLMLVSLSPVGAASANLSRSYSANGTIPNGSLVSLDPKHSGQIQLADSSNGALLVGVALPSEDSLLAVDVTAGKVQVATSGSVSALVSTLGGPIQVGDEIGVSPFSGIGMKAAAGSRVIGVAQSAFSRSTDGAVTQNVADKDGKTISQTIGYVKLNIALGTAGTVPDAEKLNGLQKAALTLTGHVVPTIRVIISLVIALTALLILITLIYAAIYGSIVSIGRNPLAKYAVFRTLGSVLGLALLTSAVASLSIIFLLR